MFSFSLLLLHYLYILQMYFRNSTHIDSLYIEWSVIYEYTDRDPDLNWPLLVTHSDHKCTTLL